MFERILPKSKNAHGIMSAFLVGLGILTTASSVQAQKFSLICMPDPQYYTNSNHPGLYDLYRKQTRWIRDHYLAYNVKHTIWVGDLTNDNTSTQWSTADSAYDVLDNANIPFAVVPGNHDYKTANSDEWVGANMRDLSLFNNTVGPQRFAGKSWYGGNMGETSDHNENNYTFFSSGSLKFLVIGLENTPRKETLTWANNLISQYPDHRVILFTHTYMTVNGVYANGAGSASGTVGVDGSDLWEECASRHSNVFMVVCGHVTESVVNTKIGVNGNTVYEMLVDYQSEEALGTGGSLGNGWLRILEFDPATNKINASTITADSGNPLLFTNGIDQFYLTSRYAKYPTGSDHLFELPYDMGPLPPYTYTNSSTAFHDRCLSDLVGGDQDDPDIAQDDNDNWVGVWANRNENDINYKIIVRGFDADGNERFSKSAANYFGNSPSNPAIAMAPDGRFVAVWQNGSTGIKMRTFNADGTPVAGADYPVASVTAPGTVSTPDVAMDDTGNFVVTWADDSVGNGSYEIKARGFAFDNSERFAAKTVNTISTGQQQNPTIAMAGNGDYVVTWDDNNAGTWDLSARAFLANETEKIAQFVVNTATEGDQRSPDVAMDDTGRFVVIWEDDTDLNTSYQIKARGFSPTGTQLFAPLTVNAIAAGNQINPAITMDPFGNWYSAWEDNGAFSGDGYQIVSNKFSISGQRLLLNDVRANSVTTVSHKYGTGNRNNPAISAHKSGRYIVAWADDMDGNGSDQALARAISGTAKSLAIKAINGSVTRSLEETFYEPDTPLTLTAIPDPGYNFVSWTGDVASGMQTANPLSLNMTVSRTITANFEPAATVDEWTLY